MTQHVNGQTYSTDCLERNIFSKLYALYGEEHMYFWTGFCDDPNREKCEIFKIYDRSVSGVTVSSMSTKIETKYLLCEKGKV